MLTLREIEEWHDPPCREQAEWLLGLADRVIGSPVGKEEIAPSIMAATDQSSPDFFRKRAEECLALSYQIDDPKKQVAILRLASWWMRLAEQYLGDNSHHGTK